MLQTTHLRTCGRTKGVVRHPSRDKRGDTAGGADPGRFGEVGGAGYRDCPTLQVFLRQLSAYSTLGTLDMFQRFIKTIRGLTPPFIHTKNFSIFTILTQPTCSHPTSSMYPVCHDKRCASVDVSHVREGLSVAPAVDTRQYTLSCGSPQILGRNVFSVPATGRVPP